MKPAHYIGIVFITLSFISVNSFSQSDCKVLKAEISLSYSGGCKKGLAQGQGEAFGIDSYKGNFKKGYPNGKGTYTWSTGEIYTGEWKNGMRQGSGIYSFFIENRDTTIKGRWLKDEYLGPVKVKDWSVTSQKMTDRYRVERRGDGDAVYVRILNFTGPEVSNLEVIGDSGQEVKVSDMTGYENIIFPFKMIIRYRSWNKMHTMEVDNFIEFIFNTKGEWEITIQR